MSGTITQAKLDGIKQDEYDFDALAKRVIQVDASGDVITPVDVPALIIDDDTTTDMTYFCYAAPGSATSAAVWRIKVIDETGAYPVFQWADGNSNYDNIADNRASLSYS